MIINLIRAFLILILLFVIIVDFDLPIIIHTPINQLFIAIIVIFIIITVDEVIGFITGLIFLIIYFKYYQRKLHHSSSSSNNSLIQSFIPGSFTSPFNSTSSVINTNDDNINNLNNININDNNSFFNFFTGDVKPKSYSNKPEIPEHYIQEVKNNNENCILMPYVSNELLKAAQDNIYNEENYNTEIKQDNNTYGIQGLNSDNIHYVAFDNKYDNYTSL